MLCVAPTIKAMYGGATAFIGDSGFSADSDGLSFAGNTASADPSTNDEFTESEYLLNATDPMPDDAGYLSVAADLWSFYESRVSELDLYPFDSSAALCFVSGDSVHSQPNGSSWDTAYRSLKECIDQLAANGDGGEIWVNGVQTTRESAFELQSDIRIYGGFDGSESARTQRDWNRSRSTLTFDEFAGDLFDAAGHLLVAINASNVLIDGFVIVQSQSADSLWCSTESGGVLYAVNSDIAIVNTVFYRFCAETGGAMYCEGGNPAGDSPSVLSGAPTILNSAFIGNRAVRSGGAVDAEFGCNFFGLVLLERMPCSVSLVQVFSVCMF